MRKGTTMMKNVYLTASLCLVLTSTSIATQQAVAQEADSWTIPRREPVFSYDRWKWFKDTYWIVPPNGIYSIYHPLGAVVVKSLRALIPSCQYVLGQVTPEGEVYMTMYNATSGEITNTPVGTMVLKKDQWTMVNQMTAPVLDGTLSHWAYMVQSKPGDPSFLDLPFAHESIPQFLSACPNGPVIREP